MNADWHKFQAKQIMDGFYHQYPHLDKHIADKRCVANVINYILNEYSSNDIIKYEDLEKLVDALEDNDDEN